MLPSELTNTIEQFNQSINKYIPHIDNQVGLQHIHGNNVERGKLKCRPNTYKNTFHINKLQLSCRQQNDHCIQKF